MSGLRQKMDESLRKKISEIVKSVMNVDISSIDQNKLFSAMPEWDSFNNLMLISRFQDEFKIEFTALEIENTKTVGSLFELIRKKVAN